MNFKKEEKKYFVYSNNQVDWKEMPLEDIYFFVKDNIYIYMEIVIEEVDPKTDKTQFVWVVRRGDVIPRFFYDNAGID
jgi:hypothetical protein